MDFQKDVIAQSHERPVVVDFWAPWCGPCRVLGPTIEALADEQKDRWSLVKLNTEEHQELAMQYGIRSIPNVKMFHRGAVIAEFAGALPRRQIMQWLDEYLPTEQKEHWASLAARLETADSGEEVQLLERFLADAPDHREARIELAKRLAFAEIDRALALTADIKLGEDSYEVAEDLRTTHEWLQLAAAPAEDAGTRLLKEAAEHAMQHDFEAAAKLLIDAVSQDKNAHNELPRRASIALFRLLGARHPATRKYRRLFDMALY